jgi:hypothetical protein
MASITDLASASSVAAADNLVINQSGTDRKVTADKFAIVGAANTFALLQTLTAGAGIGTGGNALIRERAGVVRQKLETTTIGATASITVQTGNSGRGIVMVLNASAGKLALFAVEGGAGTIIFGDSAGFTGGAASANGKINVFSDGNTISVQNGTAGTVTVSCWVLC